MPTFHNGGIDPLISKWQKFLTNAGYGHSKAFHVSRTRARQQNRGTLPKHLAPL